MAFDLSKTQIDKLGERLRRDSPSDADLVMLDAYRRSFADAYEETVGLINYAVGLPTSGRPSKSTPSILEKLRRESIRLSQIQDIAGCRIPLLNIEHQEEVLPLLIGAAKHHGFKTTIHDRRSNPSHGYRAVHVICHVMDRCVEIQIRTELQHLWAQISEKLSDLFDPAIKYGGGEPRLRGVLDKFAKSIADLEADEDEVLIMKRRIEGGESDMIKDLHELSQRVNKTRVETSVALYNIQAGILRLTGEIID